MIDIDNLQKKYFYKNEPINFKLKNKLNINIYPILVKDWLDFEDSYNVLNLNKREIPIPEIIKMSYLEFVFLLISTQNEDSEMDYKNSLDTVLSLCFHEDKNNFYYQLDENKKPIIIIGNEDNKICNYITSKDFDDIRKIILYQNIVDYDDSYISKDIREAMNNVSKIRNAGIKYPNLEDKMIFLGNKIKKTNAELLNMTYREFLKRFYSAVEEMDYKINKTAELSGNVKFDKPIEHCVYKKEKNGYEDYFADADNFVNKIKNA